MNELALVWIDAAFELQSENHELRRLMAALLLAIARNKEVVEFARCELLEFPEDTR